MAQRKAWTGTLGFGMVSIPVGMYNAVAEKPRVSFNNLHSECKGKIKQKKYCPTCDPEGKNDLKDANLVKGYELGKGQFLEMTEEDLSNVPAPAPKRIEIVEFVPLETIDLRRYDKPFFITPEPGGDRAFALLLDATEKMGRIAICKISMRDREHLATLRPFGSILLLQTLFYDDELVPAEEFHRNKIQLSEKELDLASRLVESKSVDTPDFSQYYDGYRKAIMETIEAKIAGTELPHIEHIEHSPTTDLLAGLEASLAMAGKKG